MKMIKAVKRLIVLSLLICIGALSSMFLDIVGQPDPMTIRVLAKEPDTVYQQTGSNIDVVTPISEVMSNVRSMQPVVVVGDKKIDVVESISFKNNRGILTETSEVHIDADKLVQVYNSTYDVQKWDYKNKMSTISVLWEFLVNQQGIDPMNASAIIGNIAIEGHFGEEQGTGEYLQNIEHAREVLGKGCKGYGIAQWTFSVRQDALLQYYELANEMYPDDWSKVCIVAECCMLLEEVKAYGVFKDINSSLSLEDSTGRVCLKYESYRDCETQWERVDGVYTLISDSGSGDARLCYASNIYSYFMN